jgi:hypothetical protein
LTTSALELCDGRVFRISHSTHACSSVAERLHLTEKILLRITLGTQFFTEQLALLTRFGCGLRFSLRLLCREGLGGGRSFMLRQHAHLQVSYTGCHSFVSCSGFLGTQLALLHEAEKMFHGLTRVRIHSRGRLHVSNTLFLQIVQSIEHFLVLPGSLLHLCKLLPRLYHCLHFHIHLCTCQLYS